MDRKVTEYLRRCRQSKGFSLNDVYKNTGITNSRLSRVEQSGNTNNLSPQEIRKLAKIYDVSVADMLIQLGYLEPEDLADFQSVFRGVSLLDEEEKLHIQSDIDFINRKKGMA